ncbi:MAG: AI-2E family transporter, partial [Candidatus Zixiibacteriota bacterium]
MKREHFLILLFLLVCGAFFYLFYSIIAPFFVPIAWATVFGILFYPLYERVRGWVKSRGLASLIVCVLIVVLIIGPLGYLFFALVGEARDAVVKVNELYQTGKLQELL